jgi:poly-gamma-glutamate synthesis protein (capsule biosynthesis protein)
VLANNHSLDYGEVGLLQTQELLADAGIAAIGGGTTEAEARRGVVLQFAGGPRIGVLAYFKSNPQYHRWGWYARGQRGGAALAEISAVREDVRRLRRASDAVIVQFHFGFNYRPVSGHQEVLARAAIDAGAAAVLGHHPHIAQPVEVYRGRPILYSLGNFVFGTEGRFAESGQPGLGLAVRLVFSPAAHLQVIEIDGLRVDNRQVAYQPRLLTAAELETELLPILNQRGVGFSVEEGRAVLRLGRPSAQDTTAPGSTVDCHD